MCRIPKFGSKIMKVFFSCSGSGNYQKTFGIWAPLFILVEEMVMNRKSSWRRTGFCTGGEIYTVFHEESDFQVEYRQCLEPEGKK